MDIFSEWEQKIKLALEQSEIANADLLNANLTSKIVVEVPRDPQHGDLSTNVAMVLTKVLQIKPRDIAQHLINILSKDPEIDTIEIAGAGFINFRLKASYWHKILSQLLIKDTNYGRTNYGDNKKVNVEYVSCNPTGPMHIGHCRGAVVGDVLSNLLAENGYSVTREFYINDAGGQIKVLTDSAFLRYKEALGEDIPSFPAGLYPGEYLIQVGEKLKQDYGNNLLNMSAEERYNIISQVSLDMMMQLIKNDLASLHIHHDIFFSEKSLHANQAADIVSAINLATLKGYVYEGRLPPPKGQADPDWEDRQQLLFNSTKLGDDMDRPLLKSDGSFTYFAADLAYFKNKYDRSFNEMIYVLGVDHAGYIRRLEAIAEAVAGDKSKLTVFFCQIVNLLRDGKKLTMSKRAGNFITLKEVIEEVGVDAIRFMMISRKAEVSLDFDFNKVKEQSKDNPVFYVQYAHARCYSIFKQAYEQLKISINSINLSGETANYLSLLKDDSELSLIKKLAEYPHVVKIAALYREPHRLAFYLADLAAYFHSHWSKGNENKNLRFVQINDKDLTIARIFLVKAIAVVLKNGLKIIGINAPEEMR
ncbi:arginine--tRNA ligase [Bartonella sp. DGB1]|uniref:arginine--tRNA ligase n=1 Tax=Bartonella sp. DGB1 TaxID=3239807 RepID=UPI0035246CF9